MKSIRKILFIFDDAFGPPAINIRIFFIDNTSVDLSSRHEIRDFLSEVEKEKPRWFEKIKEALSVKGNANYERCFEVDENGDLV